MDVERKIMVIGAAGVGKSAFLIQYMHNHFVSDYDPTIEDSYRKRVNSDGVILLLDVLDTAGFLDDPAPTVGESTAMYASAWVMTQKLRMLIIVYDITKRASFERVTDYWYKTKEILDQSVSEKPVVLLIGNKLDLKDERAVTTAEGEQLAKELGMMFGELSSKTRENMDSIMDNAIQEITYQNSRARELKPTIKVTPSHQAGRLSSLLKSPIFSDAVLTLNEHKWNVHKFILSARSPVFAEIFKDAAVKEVAIKGENISAEAVSAFIHFIYTGLIDFAPKIASQVKSLSDEYKVGTIGDIAADIAQKGSYYPTSESLTARTDQLSQDLLFFAQRNISLGHPAFDVALKVDDNSIVRASRALLAINSKYFKELFEKHQESEVTLNLPNLDPFATSRVFNWVCGNVCHNSTVLCDIDLMKTAVTLDLPKSFIETIESRVGTMVLNFNMKPEDWPAVLNQNIGEQLKRVAEWQAAVKYHTIINTRPSFWKKINSKSRKNIKDIAIKIGILAEEKKECGIL